MRLDALEVDEVMMSVYGTRELKAKEETVETPEGEVFVPESKTFIKETYALKAS